MNIQKIIKNTLKAGTLALALTSSAQVFGQTVPPEGGKEIVHNSSREIRWVANNDASNHNEGYGFYLGSGANEKLAMRIGHNGNVGIGVKNPTTKLDVNGTIKGNHLHVITAKLTLIQSEHTTSTATGLRFIPGESSENSIYFRPSGNVGIGLREAQEKLHVLGNGKFSGNLNATNGTFKGDITANRVRLTVGTFPDYVFAKDYDLMPLEQVEAYIKAHQHLPKVPAAAKVIKEGMDVGQINVLLMEKVEELTLHLIEQNKQMKAMQQRLQKLENKTTNKK